MAHCSKHKLRRRLSKTSPVQTLLSPRIMCKALVTAQSDEVTAGTAGKAYLIFKTYETWQCSLYSVVGRERVGNVVRDMYHHFFQRVICVSTWVILLLGGFHSVFTWKFVSRQECFTCPAVHSVVCAVAGAWDRGTGCGCGEAVDAGRAAKYWQQAVTGKFLTVTLGWGCCCTLLLYRFEIRAVAWVLPLYDACM